MKNILTLFSLCFTVSLVSAQVGPIVIQGADYVCADSIGGSQTLKRIDAGISASNFPLNTIYLDAQSNKVVPGPGVTITTGACGGGNTDFAYIEGCDFNDATNTATPFLILLTNDGTSITADTITLDGQQYTVTGTTYDGFCQSYDLTNGAQKIPGNGTAVNLSDGPYLEWTVTNAALSSGTITYGGATVPSIPGMTHQCEFRVDPGTFTIRYCGNVTAANGDFHFSSIKQ